MSQKTTFGSCTVSPGKISPVSKGAPKCTIGCMMRLHFVPEVGHVSQEMVENDICNQQEVVRSRDIGHLKNVQTTTELSEILNGVIWSEMELREKREAVLRTDIDD